MTYQVRRGKQAKIHITFGDHQATTARAGAGFRMTKYGESIYDVVGTWAGDLKSVVRVRISDFNLCFEAVK